MNRNINNISDGALDVLNALGEGFLRVNRKGIIFAANTVFAQMCGYNSSEDMVGIPLQSLYANPISDEGLLSEVIKKKHLCNRKVALIRKEDGQCWTLCNFKCNYDDKGEIVAVEGVIRDISALHKEEEIHEANKQQLLAAEQQLRAANQQLEANNQQLIANEQQLKAANHQLEANNQQLIASEQEVKRHAYNLTERVKELQCFYLISESVRSKATLAVIFQDVVTIIPSTWQYSEITRAKIRFGEEVYVSQDFEESKWQQSADIVVNGTVQGSIEVFYMTEKPELDEGPFLKEERKLLDGIARNISETIERKLAEEQLAESNQELKKALSELEKSSEEAKFWSKMVFEASISIGVGYVDGRLGLFNRAFQKLTGYSEEELKSIDWNTELTPPEWRDVEAQKLELLHSTKQAVIYEKEYIRKDGTRVPVELTVHVHLDKKGETEFYFSFVTDITERKKAAQEIRNREERYRELVDVINSGVAVYKVLNQGEFGRDYIIQDFNKTALELEGLSKEEVVGKNLVDIRPNIDNYGLISIFKKVWETGENAFFPVKEYKDDKYSNYYENRVFRLPNGDIVAVYDDVTKRENAFKVIKDNQERYNLAINATRDGIYDWNLITNEIYFSVPWKNMLGYKDHELANDFSVWEKLTHPDDVKRSWGMLHELIDRKLDSFKMEFKMKHKKGNWVDILSRANVLFDEDGKALRLVGTHVDISEQKQSRIRLAESEEQFRMLSENSSECLWVMNKQFIFTYLSSALEHITGFKPEEWIGTPMASHFTQEEFVKIEAIAQKHIENRKTSQHVFFETKMLNKDNEELDVEISSTLLLDDDGEFNGIQGITRDISESKKAAKALSESETRFKALHNASFGGIAIHDKGWILECNKGLSETTGFEIDELIGMDGLLLIAEESREEVMKNIQTGYEEPYEAFGIHKNGKKYPLRLEAKEIPYKGKQVRVVEFRDITVQKEAERKLKESEEMLRNIINNATSVIYSHDTKHIVDFVSPQIEDVLGYTQEEAKVKWLNLLSENPINQQAYQNTVNAIETGEKLEPYELELIHKNGKKVYIEAHEAPVVRDGKTVSIVGIFNDITARKRIEDELKQLAKRLQIATESASIGIWELDLKNNILVWDQQMFNLYGANPDDFGGAYETWKEGLHPDDVERSDAEVQKAIVGKGDFHTLFRVVWPNGEIHFIEAYAKVLTDDGVPESMTGVNWDVTERIKAEQELIEAKEKAEESDRLKSAFLSNMSHEIRTPMNGILGFTNLLNEPHLSGEKREKFIEIIKKSGDRMLNTVNDIIDISKIDAGQVKVSKSDINLYEEIEHHFEFFYEEAAAKGLALVLYNKLPKACITICDKVKLDSIVSNLIKNAIKYTDKGKIEIHCSIENDVFSFKIIDTGIGISAERVHSIFNRFEQADISDVHARQGSGLGLAITKAYVEMLGGSIDVESKFGKGSTFYVSLPWNKKLEKPTVAKPKEVEQMAVQHQINVLIAEDDEISYQHLKIILSPLVNSIKRVENGIDAVNFMKKNPATHVVFMDVKMPKLDGYTAAKEIRKFNKEVVIISQTAYALDGDRENALLAGCNDYMPKPVNKKLLLELLKKHLK